MKRLVADTGPILHLHEADALYLLPLIGKIFLPPTVVKELYFHAPSLWPEIPPKWVKSPILSVAARQRTAEWKLAGLLHDGEAEALGLAQEIKSDWLLTDDAAARLMAESLGIEVHGSIGVNSLGGGQPTSKTIGSGRLFGRPGKIVVVDVSKSSRIGEGCIGKTF